MKRTLVLIVTFVLATMSTAFADITVLVTNQSCSDCAFWDQLGPDYTTVSNPFTATTLSGITVTGSFAGGGTGQVRTQTFSWYGNFLTGDHVLWTNRPGQGPLSASPSARESGRRGPRS